MKICVVVPTFQESALVPAFLKSWDGIRNHDIEIFLVNGNPGDATSALVRQWTGNCTVHEIQGNPDLFWTGLVCLGLRAVAAASREGDGFVLTNIDVKFEGDPISILLENVDHWENKQMTIPVVGADGRPLSAGIQVRSWALSLNRHLHEGVSRETLPEGEWTKATYLPTRFLFCSVRALLQGHFPNEKYLPHYCADYEYSNRLRLHGYMPWVFAGPSAEIAENNTGYDTYIRETTFLSRLARIGDIKCAYHFGYRFHFVRLTYPLWAVIPGMVTHFAKILLEIAFGGKRIDRFRIR